MDQQELERRLAEIFGADQSRVSHGMARQEVDNPAFVPPGSPGFNPTIHPTVTITEETWTDANGNKFVAQRWPDGTIKENGRVTAPNKSSGPQRTPEQQRSDAATATENETKAQEAIRIRNESQWNADPANRANGGSGRYEDHATRDARLKKEKDDADEKARRDRLEAETSATRASQEARAAAAANKADNKIDTVKGSDGKTYTRVTVVSPDGKNVTVSNFGPDGKPVGEIPGESATAFGVEPAGAPEQTYTVGQVTTGLRTYSTWLSGQVKLYHDTNGAQGVKPDEATKLMTRRIALAESAIKEQEGLGNAQTSLLNNATTQRGQTLGDTQSRRAAAERIATDVNTRGDARLKYLLPGQAGTHLAARQEEMQNALGYAGQWGGMRESPEVDPNSFPALAELRNASMAGIQTAAQGGPRIFDPRNPAARPLPAAPVDAAALEAENQATQAGFHGAIAPLTVPVQAPVSLPIVPPAVNPIDQSPIVLPTQLPGVSTAGPPLNQGQDASPAGIAPGDPSSALGQPGDPGYGSTYQQPDTAPIMQPGPHPLPVPSQYGDAGDAQSQMSPRFMQETRYGQGNYFDPDLAGNELMQRLGIDPEIMRQAISGAYG